MGDRWAGIGRSPEKVVGQRVSTGHRDRHRSAHDCRWTWQGKPKPATADANTNCKHQAYCKFHVNSGERPLDDNFARGERRFSLIASMLHGPGPLSAINKDPAAIARLLRNSIVSWVCRAAGIAQKSWARNAAGTMNTTSNAAPNLARIPSNTESPPISRNAMLPSNKNEERGMPSPAISSSAPDQCVMCRSELTMNVAASIARATGNRN